MTHALRERTTPLALAKARQVIEFKGKVSDFERLTQVVSDDLAALETAKRPRNWQDSPLNGRLSFSFADVQERLPQVDGSADTSVPAVCQRCLEPCTLALETAIHYLLLPSGETGEGRSDYEVWELERSVFRPAELVEEALLMALPIAALHADPADCGPLAATLAADAPDVVETTRPFADLRQRMKGNE